MTNPLRNITGHLPSTLTGVLTSAFQAALIGAANTYTQTGNTTSWQQYAISGGAAAIPVIIGALYAPKK